MKLTELFKDPKRILPWKRTRHDAHEGAGYSFPFKNGYYEVDFFHFDEGWWELQFSFYRKGSRTDGDSQGIVGHGGGEIVIFATIHAIVQDFKQLENPNGFMFQAKEPSRQKLYRRLAKRLGHDVDEEIVGPGGDVEFHVQV